MVSMMNVSFILKNLQIFLVLWWSKCMCLWLKQWIQLLIYSEKINLDMRHWFLNLIIKELGCVTVYEIL
jgi:hypothetical protein